jgi:hypothetical protein
MVEALRRGRQLKDWIDDPALGHCQYNMSDLQFNRMVREDRWEAVANDKVDPEARYWALEFQNLGLPMEGERYRQRRIRKHGIRSYNGSRGFNDYEMSTGQGCLIIQDIRRFDGPRFYELAVAQYKQDNRNDMSTLKHIFVENIVNDVTVDFMRKQFWGNITQNKYETTANLPRLEFAYNSDLYPAILGGTQFGIIAAQIVLGAFQRGTHRISRIVAWKSDGAFQMRFDIEPIHG